MATKWILHYDMTSPSWATSQEKLYRAAIEQSAWADKLGCPEVILSHHRFAEDGYLPAPMTLGAAIAAVTESTRINLTALLLTLLDPVHAAEEVAVLDLISGGRVDMVCGLAYVDYEFAMSGLNRRDRARLIESKLPAFLAGLTGDWFEYEGRRIRVRPQACQRPRPPVLLGGSVKASTERAARLADGFMPMDTALIQPYYEACDRIGRLRGTVVHGNYPFFVYVTDDPDKAWATIAPHALHELNMYGKWQVDAGFDGGYRFEPMTDVGPVKESGVLAVVTPEECLTLAESLEPPPVNVLRLKPLMAGLDPDFGWAGLELFAAKVLPHLQTAAPAPLATVLPVYEASPVAAAESSAA